MAETEVLLDKPEKLIISCLNEKKLYKCKNKGLKIFKEIIKFYNYKLKVIPIANGYDKYVIFQHFNLFIYVLNNLIKQTNLIFA